MKHFKIFLFWEEKTKSSIYQIRGCHVVKHLSFIQWVRKGEGVRRRGIGGRGREKGERSVYFGFG